MSKIAEYQKKAAPLVKQLLQDCKGVEKAMGSQRIIDEIQEHGINLRDPRGVRRVIQFLRFEEGMVNLVGNNKGYYLEYDPAKLKDYAEKMRATAQPMIEVAKRIEKKLKETKKKEAADAQIGLF